jgi:bile acid-coenzyme A ligase
VSFAGRIRQLADERPDDPAYRHLGVDGAEPAFTWSWLDRRSSQLAGALAERGVGEGDRLSIAIRNSPPLVLAALAAWKLGAVPVPIRWDLPDWEHERLREVVAAPVHLGAEDVTWIEATGWRAAPEPDELPGGGHAVSPRTYGICSSGSTGTPKVILGAWPAIWDPSIGVPFVEPWQPMPRPQTILVPAPMYHTNGFATLLNLLAGDRLVIMERFDAARLVDAVERHRITTFTATPTMLQRIADLPGIDDRDLSSLEWILQGAAPMPPSLMHRWVGLIGAERILMVYGMTEALGFAALRGDEWLAHPGSVGRGVRDTEFRILDADGKELPAGDIGEIYLRSPTGDGFAYLGDAVPPPATDDGFRTVGDMGYLDDDGYLYLVDRRVDMIVTGGANVFPAEVEAALVDHPGIADVVVVGLQDPQWGRRVHAIVEPADPAAPPTADEVVAYAKGRLAAYKVPKTVELVDAIPRSEATKVNRRALVDARGG